MEKKRSAFCLAIWFSGFFCLGAVVHMARLLLRVPVAIGTWNVPLRFSAVLVIFFGTLSAWLLYSGCKRP